MQTSERVVFSGSTDWLAPVELLLFASAVLFVLLLAVVFALVLFLFAADLLFSFGAGTVDNEEKTS